jgi:hypothetical protein
VLKRRKSARLASVCAVKPVLSNLCDRRLRTGTPPPAALNYNIMRRALRYSLVWLLALTFAASGLSWQHCVTIQSAAAAPVAIHQVSDATDHAHAGHHGPRHGDHDVKHQHAADEPAQPGAADHVCGKCCSVCTVAGVVPPGAGNALFAISFVMFSFTTDDFTGGTIRVDPGIPKRNA